MEASAATTIHAMQEQSLNTTTSATQFQERGDPGIGRTLLQRLQDALKRRFGSEILRTSSSNVKAAGNNKIVQRREETPSVLLQDDAMV